MRVTNSMMLSSTLHDLNRSLARLQRDQVRLSTGRVIQRPSDDPAGASSAMTMRTQLRRSEQHQRSITDAQGWLGTADTAIVTGLDLMNRVKAVAVQAANDGTADDVSRSALAAEVGNLRDELLALANTEFLGRPVFSGTAGAPAYDAAGVYGGNAAAVIRDVGPNTTIRINLTGPEVFGDPAAPEGDAFAMLDRLQAAILAGDMDAVATEHARLDGARGAMASAAAEIGARGARLEAIGVRREADESMVRQALSQVEDADVAEALISVKASEHAYTAALQAAGRVLPPSLLDYLR